MWGSNKLDLSVNVDNESRFALHAFAEPGQGTGLLLVAALPEPALYGPHIPVQLLGQAFQPLLVWMLATQGPKDRVT